jgi:fibronectin type 3 domain-containing protein
VYRSTTSGGTYTKINSSLVTGTTYTDATVVSGQTYYYETTSVDSSGVESPTSNAVQVAIP